MITIGRVDSESCPYDWKEYNGHCYFFGNKLEEQSKLRTWHNAKAECELLGAHLVVIEDQAERSILTNF